MSNVRMFVLSSCLQLSSSLQVSSSLQAKNMIQLFGNIHPRDVSGIPDVDVVCIKGKFFRFVFYYFTQSYMDMNPKLKAPNSFLAMVHKDTYESMNILNTDEIVHPVFLKAGEMCISEEECNASVEEKQCVCCGNPREGSFLDCNDCFRTRHKQCSTLNLPLYFCSGWNLYRLTHSNKFIHDFDLKTMQKNLNNNFCGVCCNLMPFNDGNCGMCKTCRDQYMNCEPFKNLGINVETITRFAMFSEDRPKPVRTYGLRNRCEIRQPAKYTEYGYVLDFSVPI